MNPRKIFILLLGSLLLSTPAMAEYFHIQSYRINVEITREGYADFEEIIEVVFSEPRHGIFRFIPLHSEVNGKRVERLIRNIETEGVPSGTSRESGNLVIKIGDRDVFVEGRQVYRIRYRVLNPLDFFEDHSQFYWDLLGVSWPVHTEQFSFSLRFPEGIALNEEDVRCFSGAAGSRGQDVEWAVESRLVEGKSKRRFESREGLTVAVRLPQDVFTPMSESTFFLQRHGLLLFPPFLLIAGFWVFYKHRNRREVIATEYFPPEGISPAVVGGFVDHSVDSNDILCLIPYLANMGYLRMELEEGNFWRGDNITFFKLKEAGPELLPFESRFFNALFASGDEVQLKSLKEKFYTQMAAVKELVRQWIRKLGWYEPGQIKYAWITGGVAALTIIGGLIAVFAFDNLDGIALIITGVILLIIAILLRQRTPKGNEIYRRIEGFRQFVKKAERPVIERLMAQDPLYYDKTMPFALAFGYLKPWNKHFEGLLREPPGWYRHGGIHANTMQSWNNFATEFPKEISQIGSVFSSSPGGSSSGGGSSGGGSGGGGGGSW